MRRFFASRGAVAAAALLCIALMLVSANVIAARYWGARADLTAAHLYTLSPGTVHTLAQIDEPITLDYYYSQRLGRQVPAYAVYAARIRELLAQYAAAAHGKLILHIYDPQPFSRLEDRALAAGLQAVPLNAEGDHVYFGLAGTNSTDDQQVIPFFSPDRARFLEYDLTRLVHDLAVPKKTVVGLISGLPLDGNPMAALRGMPSRPWAILRELQQLYTVNELDSTVRRIPAGIDVLMVVLPQHLSQQTLFAIDQFVLKGGKALIFADPYSEFMAVHRGANGAGKGTAGTMPRLFKAWGIRMLPGVVAGDRRDAQLVNMPSAGGARPMHYVAWLGLHEKNLSRKDVITADLHHLTMASVGILEPVKGATTTIEPLISTSADSEQIPLAKIQGLPDIAGLYAGFKPSGRRYMLAAHITGTADSAFPDGAPKPPAKKKGAAAAPASKAPALKKSVRPINVVVVADTDMLADRFWVREQSVFGRAAAMPVTNNGDLVADAIEVLAGGEDLVGLRSRGTSARPFVVVDRIRRAAQARYSAEKQALEKKLTDSQQKLDSLTQSNAAGMPATLSAAQDKTIEQFRADMLETRRQLRHVQAALRHNIRRLKAVLEFVNIALVPILVALVAVILGFLRLRRRRRRAAEA